MSIHSSLGGGKRSERHRNVLKRYERIQKLQDKDLWPDGRSAFGLPKVKSIKFKMKKTSSKDKAAVPADAGTTPATGAAPAATPAKSAKGAEKGAKK